MNALRFGSRSIAEVLYPRGTIVVCRNPGCGKPLYRLERSIYAGESVPKSTEKYIPVTLADIEALLQRRDLEPGQLAFLKAMSITDLAGHCERIPELKPHAMADCPACGESFAFGRVRDEQDGGAARFGDRGYVIKLAVIPPTGQARRAS
jgi:hypothetical protein